MSCTFALLFPFSGRFTPPEWALGLSALQFPTGTSRVYLHAKRVKRDAARCLLVERALEMDAKYILFLDDDTHPPPDAVHKLFMALETADKDVVACGGVYTSKSIPSEPLIYKDDEDSGPFWKWKAGDVFEVGGIATGCLMIRASVFKELPKPWFRDIDDVSQIGDDPAVQLETQVGFFTMTDDLYWCRKVRQAGFRILAHGGVLCVHWDQQGNPFTLPRDSYPMKDGKTPWYAHFGVIEENVVGSGLTYSHLESAHIGDVELPEGWLSQSEASALHDLAKGRNVLELGAFRGRSTVCMAMSAKSVTSVDWHQGDSDVELKRFGSSLDDYRRNIAPYPNVTPIVGRFEDEVPKLKGREFDLIFVDGAHNKESVIRDVGYALSFKPAVIAVHDWGMFDVNEGVKALGLEPTRVEHTLAIFERPVAAV